MLLQDVDINTLVVELGRRLMEQEEITMIPYDKLVMLVDALEIEIFNRLEKENQYHG